MGASFENSLIAGMLGSVRNNIVPHKLAAFDVETYKEGDEHRFLCGAVWSADYQGHFWEPEEMKVALLHRRFKNHWIFATSLDFDFFALFGEDFGRFNIELMFRGSGLICAEIKDRGRNRTRKFLDTMNYYPVGLNKLGECIGLKKLGRPKSWLRKPETEAERAEMAAYNVQDARITYEWIKWFQAKLNGIGGQLKKTIAATSLWYWRRHYQAEPLYQPKKSIMEKQLNAYYGGRTECFYRGLFDRKCYIYDVNAMYAWAMCNDFPKTDTIFHRLRPEIRDIFDYHGVVRCDVITPPQDSTFYPLLPYRDETNKLLFPVGRWRGAWYSCIELRRALDLGYTIMPREAYLYYESYRPFERIQRDYYRLRRESPDLKLVYKLMGNSLYGKWGQRWKNVQEYRHISEFAAIPKKFTEIKNGFVISERSREPAPFANPIISLYASAYARVRLHELLTRYGAWYCDTDSLITDAKIPTSDKLGDLKLERTLNRILLVKPKVYFFDDEVCGVNVRIKGFRVKSKEQFDFMLDNGYAEQTHILKFKESIRQQRRTLTESRVFKRFRVEDTKRDWFDAYTGRFQQSQPVRVEP